MGTISGAQAIKHG